MMHTLGVEQAALNSECYTNATGGALSTLRNSLACSVQFLVPCRGLNRLQSAKAVNLFGVAWESNDDGGPSPAAAEFSLLPSMRPHRLEPPAS